MLSFTALTGTDWRHWNSTAHLETKVCFLKILTHGEVNRMQKARVLSLGFYLRFFLPIPENAGCGVDLSQKLVVTRS